MAIGSIKRGLVLYALKAVPFVIREAAANFVLMDTRCSYFSFLISLLYALLALNFAFGAVQQSTSTTDKRPLNAFNARLE